MERDGKSGNGVAQADSLASRLLSERQVAERLNVAEVTLQQWRCQGKGPPFVRLGRMIRYRASDLEVFLISQEIVPPRSCKSRGGSDGEPGAGLRAARGAS